MLTRGGRRAAGCVVAALVAGTLSGCNSGSPDVAAPSAGHSSGMTSAAPTSAASPTTSASTGSTPSSSSASGTSSHSSGTPSQQELVAKIAAGAPPKDLTWRYPHPPAAWKKLKTDPGTLQWQLKGRCVITLGQPAGLGTAKTPDSRGVLEHTAEQNSSAFPGKPAPKYHGRKSRMVTNFVDGLNGTSQVKMQESLVDYGKSIRSRMIAYRNGDFALTVTSLCATPELFATASKSDLDPFINKLQARTTY
ncbi:MAG TPA: hypothetical protein VG502_02630 [Flexivirga sp.]|uniref:hypothetical protein n=1 Tax=Flexivirga sp. TaxID=1962927 RepID=UPI002B73A4C6|nr:hypothetical protein [Flexivirga sp.]HWC21174.1 hypothetical protein [Flexivirga sp.]